MKQENKLKIYKLCQDLKTLFMNDETGARLLLSRDFQDRLEEFQVNKYNAFYENYSERELNTYIDKTSNLDELISIFYSRWYTIKMSAQANEIEKKNVRRWFIHILERIEEELDKDVACFKENEVVSVRLISLKDRMKQIVDLNADGSAMVNGLEISSSGNVEIMSYIETVAQYFKTPRLRQKPEKDNYYTVTINDEFVYEHYFESINNDMGDDISDELRIILNNEKLFAFDGKRNRVDRIFFKYYRDDKYEGRCFETIELNRHFSSYQYIRNSSAETFELRISGDRVIEIIDNADIEKLSGRKKSDVTIYDENCSREYTLTFNFKNGEEKVIEGSYDSNGLPKGWPAFIDKLQNLMGNTDAGDVFNKNYYSKVKHRKVDYMLSIVKKSK